MPNDQSESHLSSSYFLSSAWHEYITNYPLFSHLTTSELEEFGRLMKPIEFKAHETIVEEGNFVDCVYFILKGQAEVSKRDDPKDSQSKNIFITNLKEGESIGMTFTGIFSKSGKRTATVTAVTDMLLLQLKITDLHRFLKRNSRSDQIMMELLESLLKLDFLKAAYPFTKLDKSEIYAMSSQIKEVVIPANTIIFNKGDKGEHCYLIRSGQVEIFIPTNDNENRMAILEAPQLFGEAALLTSNNRVASARTLTECKLLVLERAVLIKTLETSKSFLQSMIGFMVNRFRPMRNEKVYIHKRITRDKREVITLHNTESDRYYNLTEHSLFIWEQIDGIQTIHDLTMAFFEKYHGFIPEIICNLLYSMADAGFVTIPAISFQLENNKTVSTWQRLINKLVSFKVEFIFPKTDEWLKSIYQNCLWICFTRPVQILLFVFIIFGFLNFITSYHKISTLGTHPSFGIFLLLYLPISFLVMILHEMGHAFSAVNLGYKVKRFGFGLVGLVPVAFIDTSSLWLADPSKRLKVDVAGIYMDILSAGCLSLICLWSSTNIGIYFWLICLLLYVNAFRNLSMVKEYDGYFILSNLLDRQSLRLSSIAWLVNGFPDIFKNKTLIKKFRPQIYYWFACLIYLLITSLLFFLTLQSFFIIFSLPTVLGVPVIYISISFAILILFFDLLSIKKSIKKYKQSYT